MSFKIPYIEALKLIERSVEADLFNMVGDDIGIKLVGDDQWYLISKEQLAHKLMTDEEGVLTLNQELSKLEA